MTYDPNYNYDEDDENGEEDRGMDMIDDDDEEEENDEYSDDDDMSWKVRRAAAKCLESVISSRHEMLAEFYKTLSPTLIARFKGVVFIWLLILRCLFVIHLQNARKTSNLTYFMHS